MAKKQSSSEPLQKVESLIFTIREVKVILDSDLAPIYGVTTSRLNQQVKRNADRFPDDFVFQLTKDEFNSLLLQNATSKVGRGGRRKLPYVFTEHGAIMVANVLKTKRAAQMSIFVVRAFVRLREVATTYRELAERLKELEHKVGNHDKAIQAIMEAIRQLMQPPEKPKRKIGFRVEERRRRYGNKK